MLVSLAMLESVISETRSSVPGRPGRVSRYDVVSNREGVRQLFLMFEPLRGWRHVVIRRTKAAVDWAEVIADLLENQYPDVGRVRLVMDNLNPHAGGSLYQAFPAEQARELYQRLEIHYTPKHGSWLDMAEIELSILMGQCLDRRIGSDKGLESE
jgi:DDE superfamily endonuclease